MVPKVLLKHDGTAWIPLLITSLAFAGLLTVWSYAFVSIHRKRFRLGKTKYIALLFFCICLPVLSGIICYTRDKRYLGF